MATRHQVREAIVGLLFSLDLGNDGVEKHLDSVLEEKKIRNKQRDFALDLFKGVTDHLAEVDEAIIKHLKDWDFDRLGSIERATLRLGGYEIMFGELDSAVIINEAIEVAKAFGSEQSPKFINGVLDAISRDK
jgi:N utilization substance protein B